MTKEIGIFCNIKQNDIIDISKMIHELLKERDIKLYTENKEIHQATNIPYLPLESFLGTIELMLVIGGDGTFLEAANIIKDTDTPILGINRGHLGFLSELEVGEFEERLEGILSGYFHIEERMLIHADIYRKGKLLKSFEGLNDVVINRNPLKNIIELEVFLNEHYIDSYQGDGMIVATPTGSTGYSLSAGGPLIYPGTDCLILNPVCAHVLGASPIIVPADGVLDIHVTHAEIDAIFTSDGKHPLNLKKGDHIIVTKAEKNLRMVQLGEHQFFEAVRNKLLDRKYRKMYHRSEHREK